MQIHRRSLFLILSCLLSCFLNSPLLRSTIALSLIASSAHRNSPLLWGREVNRGMLLRRWSLFWIVIWFRPLLRDWRMWFSIGDGQPLYANSLPLLQLSFSFICLCVLSPLSSTQTVPVLWAEQTSSECLCSDCWETVNRTWRLRLRRLWLA